MNTSQIPRVRSAAVHSVSLLPRLFGGAAQFVVTPAFCGLRFPGNSLEECRVKTAEGTLHDCGDFIGSLPPILRHSSLSWIPPSPPPPAYPGPPLSSLLSSVFSSMSLLRDLLGVTPQTAQGVLQLNERLLLHEAAVPAPPASSLELSAAATAPAKERHLGATPLGAGSEKLARRGLSRDLRAAVTGGTASLPSLPAVMHRPHAKRSQERRPVSKWRLCAFTNCAREDGLCLVHWRKVTDQQALQLQQQVAAMHAQQEGSAEASLGTDSEQNVKGKQGESDISADASDVKEEAKIKVEEGAAPRSGDEHGGSGPRSLSLQNRLRAFLITPEKEYPFAKFNVKTVQPALTREVYDKYIQPLDSSWSAEETFQLWQLVHEYDLQWPVVFDAFPASFGRSVEELKQRYYAVAKRVVARQFEEKEEEELAKGPAASNSVLARLREEKQRHPLVRFNFNFVAECQRRLLLERQQRVGVEELQAEQSLQSEIRAAEGKVKKLSKAREDQRRLQRRFGLPADSAPRISAASFLELQEPTCTTLSALLEKTKNSRVSEKGMALIDNYLSSLGVAPPVCFTYNIAESYWGLRAEVSTMLHLRQRVEKLKEELNYWTTMTANLPPQLPAGAGPTAPALLGAAPPEASGAPPASGVHTPGTKLAPSPHPTQFFQAAQVEGRNRGGREDQSPQQPPSRDAAFPAQGGVSRSPSVASGRAQEGARPQNAPSLPPVSVAPSPHSASPSPPPRPPHVASVSSHPSLSPAPPVGPVHPGLGPAGPAGQAPLQDSARPPLASMHAHFLGASGAASPAFGGLGPSLHGAPNGPRGPSPQLAPTGSPQLAQMPHRPMGAGDPLAYGAPALEREERPAPHHGVAAGPGPFQAYPHFHPGFQAQFGPGPRGPFPVQENPTDGTQAGSLGPNDPWGAQPEGAGPGPGQVAQPMGENMQSPYMSQMGANRGPGRSGQSGTSQSKPPRARSRSSSASAPSPYPSPAMSLTPSEGSAVSFGTSGGPAPAHASFPGAEPKEGQVLRARGPESGARAPKKQRAASRKSPPAQPGLAGYPTSLPGVSLGPAGPMLGPSPVGPDPHAHHAAGLMHAHEMGGVDHGAAGPGMTAVGPAGGPVVPHPGGMHQPHVGGA
ncbi:Myb family DNA-binding domain-containing protein [Toxoplasma gondii ME49]|uniref:Myb family DNA-binding domain-containing protein n=1 Tax=Toxoplasma gondii (strain ATCC 50611 / Me49) TaxID=508771 RepID=S8F930_TOXGM|nr:Myb family DNA-binding domain-containing protein [Toxoplasma gondii ME49]EPT31272.1 Myb family DNA-binding domain-containing protein [Toxoplasma gondii ME49]|eukprot:XP_002371126.2 Myb family DNA-binding domain-containing protein [Toxoplasma gondii ME49]